MIGAALVYGVALTGKFGDPKDVELSGRLAGWMEALIEGDEADELGPAKHFNKLYCVEQPTAEECWRVAGFRIDADKMEDPAYVTGLRRRWDTQMADLDDDIREALYDAGKPKVQMIYGNF